MRRIVFAVCGALLIANPLPAADWPHWRGEQRNDVTQEPSGWTGQDWPSGGEVWRKPVGIGSSSPVVVKGKLYITGWHDGRDYVLCLDAKTGQELWRTDYACPKYGRHSEGDKGIYAGPSSTPAFDLETNRLYTLSTDGDLLCWETQPKGQKVWGLNFYDQYKVKQRPDVGKNSQRDYGYTTSPLLYKNWAIVEVGDDEGTIMAFDKTTGKRVWASECQDEAGHTASPVLLTVETVPCLAVLTLRNLVVMRLDPGHEGKTIATYPWATDFANNIPTPTAAGDSVIITSAYNHYAMCRLKITLQGAEKLWETENPSGVCSPVVHKDKIYWAWRGVHCVDLKTGREIWLGGKVGECGSCLITTDDRLIVWADQGELLLAETAERSPDKYTELASRRRLFGTDVWPHVVLADGRLYVKDREGNLACLSLAEKPAAVAKTTPKPKPMPAPGKTSPNRPVMQETAFDLKEWPGKAGLLLAWKAGQKEKLLSPEKGLTLSPRESAMWDDAGRMQLSGGAFVVNGADEFLLKACRESHQLAIEAVITPADVRQEGPARIITFSTDGFSRNFSLAQEGDELILRLRTPRTGENGMNPQTALGRISANEAVHLVVTYAEGKLACYLNGKLSHQTDQVQGDFGNWSAQHLLFGNEWGLGSERDWQGTIERVAIFHRGIGPQEAEKRDELFRDSPGPSR